MGFFLGLVFNCLGAMACVSAQLLRAVRTQRSKALKSVSLRAFSSVKYAKSHEWFKVDGNNGVLGISDYAQGQLGEVVYCDLPDVGATFSKKDTIVTLESVKAVGEVYAPTDCEIVEVNEKLNDEPALVNSSPQSDGWLIKVKFTGDLADMMDQT